jgi:1,4-dihydroxy-2-naphthoyl-CoA synthase
MVLSRGMGLPAILKLIEDLFTPVFNSGDAVEGRSAFLEKHKPKWKAS